MTHGKGLEVGGSPRAGAAHSTLICPWALLPCGSLSSWGKEENVSTSQRKGALYTRHHGAHQAPVKAAMLRIPEALGRTQSSTRHHTNAFNTLHVTLYPRLGGGLRDTPPKPHNVSVRQAFLVPFYGSGSHSDLLSQEPRCLQG